ncbi:hypothetical protein RB195_001880 [Necator americanus]|uniref:Uncharacterized protein n=1 Tax=Necator americanus TaxID=51031 RepID=A0ABR1DGP6_NECAM
MKRCLPVLNTANGVAVEVATLPIWRGHFNALLNLQAPSVSELVHAQRPTYIAVSEEAPTESVVLVCMRKMMKAKSGGDDGISAECSNLFLVLGFVG